MPSVKRTDPDLVGAYRKDPHEESFLVDLNAALEPFEQSLYQPNPEPLPSLYIVGVPRSGTTLLYQTVAAHLDVAYISNLAAAFWEAPTVGMQLARKLLSPQAPARYQSLFGRTSDPAGPHEFGYFWAKHLRLASLSEPSDEDRDAIDWNGLRRTILNMASVHGRPIAFKPLIVGWYTARMHREIPGSVFVWVQRDRLQNCISIYRMREEMLGSADKWMSLIPKAYNRLHDKPAWEQVAGQVWHVEQGFRDQFDQLPEARKLRVRYESFCRDPASTLAAIQDRLAGQGHRPELHPPVPDGFEPHAIDPAHCNAHKQIALALQRLKEEYSDTS